MPPQQKSALDTLRRVGLSSALVLSAISWGFTKYDATNASAAHVQAVRDSIVTRRTIDSLNALHQYQELRGAVFRTDSAVQKLCVRLKAGC